jgi:small-conductance mechanosensitive channel
MSSLLEKMSRWMPLFMGIMALAVIIQVSNSFGVFVRDTSRILAWIGTHAWAVASALGSAAVVCWLLARIMHHL